MKQCFYGKLGGLYFRYRIHRHFSGRIDKDFFVNTIGSYNLAIHRKLRVI